MSFAGLVRSEMARIARKELKAELEPLRKAVSAQRSTIAKLRKELTGLDREVKVLRRRAGRVDARPPASKDAAAPAQRFSVKGLVSHRQRLGFTRDQYARLVGVSAQSIYKWERGDARPRAAQLQELVRVRGLGKRQALAQLEAAEG